MELNRRDFLLLAAAAAAGCQCGCASAAGAQPEHVVNAGPAARFAADGLYTQFHNQGFFLIRRDGRLFALSSYCTHRKCKLSAEPDRSFYCKCHGSTFAPDGKVTQGPATRNLPQLRVEPNDQGQLLVTVPRT